MDQKRLKRLKRQRGFTLTEIMVVVFIIGLLSTVVVINVFGASSEARVTTTKSNIASVSGALEQYALAIGDYPSEQQGLIALVEKPNNLNNAARYPAGGFINRLPQDAWGRDFIFKRPGEKSGRGYDLYSLGADSEEGGEALNADIGNWN